MIDPTLQLLRIALQTIKLSPQNSSGESHSWSIVKHKSLRELNALGVPSVYRVFQDEKSKWIRKKSVKRKNALKTPQDEYN